MRYDSSELTEMARVNFQPAMQKAEESLEDWADRVITLATSAYKDLPESHGVQEADSKCCQGCVHKDDAKYACFEHPRNIQEALNAVKQHQCISQAVDGQKPRGRRKINDIAVNQITLEDVKKVVEDVMERHSLE